MKVEIENDFLQYIKKVFPAAIVLTAAALMTHGSILFTQRIGVDTEFMMNGYQVFDQTGRQGLIWLARMLEIDWFNPYLVQVLTMLFMILAPICFGYLFYRFYGQKVLLNVALILFGLSYIVSPLWAAQIYFFNQSVPVTCSCVLTAAAVFFAEEGRRTWKTKWYYILISVLLVQFTFSSYQILAMLYVTAVVMTFLCVSARERQTVKQQIHWILYHVGVFLTGFGIYMGIARTFFYSEMGIEYQEGQIGWLSGGVERRCGTVSEGFLSL